MKLDAAVCAAYGWPANLAGDEILERLLILNPALAGSNPLHNRLGAGCRAFK